MTPLQRLKAAQNIRQAAQTHTYYLENPGCTIRQAETFNPNISIIVIREYSKLRTKCQSIIDTVLNSDGSIRRDIDNKCKPASAD